MCTTRVEKSVRALVLLSPAVHDSVLPDPAYYRRALVVDTWLDLVLLADRSKLELLLSQPTVDHRRVGHRGLTGHGGSHNPRVWRRAGLDSYVRDTWLPAI
jgi:hypothetical protein